MTIANTKASSVFNANGVTRDFELGFVYDENVSGLAIKVIDPDGEATEVTDNYSIYNGVLTYPTVASGLDPLANGYKLTVERLTPQTQSIDLIQQGPLDAETLEGGYDKLTMEVQELQDASDRSIKFPLQTEGETDAQQYIEDLQDLLAQGTAQAGIATQQAGIATTKASEATSSASAAATSAQNAATSESNAASSATAASNSAAAAAASEQHTIQNEELLQEYVDQAEASATSSAGSATAAATSATQAATSATTAVANATQAQTSASNASTQATNAANSATAAASSANTASGYASDAQSSASTATEKANAASQSATAAAASATSAGTSADNAAASALVASTSATAAQDALAEVQSYRRIDRTYIAGTAIDDYTGSLTVFDLGLDFDLADYAVDVFVNGKGYQGVKAPVDFTVSGDVVTFVEAVPVGAVVQFRINASTTVIIADSVDVDAKIADHNASSTAHSDIRTAITNHTGNSNIHVTSSDKSNWNAKQAALSTDQIAATNSGVTAAKVSGYDTHVANSDIHVTASQKTAWSGKQDAISDLSTIRSGAAAGATAVQPAALTTKQDTLVSGTNIKTVNGSSLLGSGNVDTLPSQTGQSGKFLSTNGTSASWAAVSGGLSNTATAANSLTINGTANTSSATSVNIGDNSQAAGGQSVAIGAGSTTSNAAYANTNCVAIGFASRANYSSGTAIGRETETTGNNGVAVGYESVAATNAVAIGKTAKATAQSAIQIGTGTNSTASTVQINGTQILNTSGKIPTASLEADLTTKADTDLSNVTKPYVTETYVNGTSWYRVWSDGWCEQGGEASASSKITVTFPKAFSNTNYTVVATSIGTAGEIYAQCIQRTSASQMTIYNYGGSASLAKSWYACGYIA